MKQPIDIYCRISKDPTNNEDGVRRQEKQIRQLLKVRGLPVGEVIIDNDISASTYSKKARPGFKRVRDRIESGVSGGVAAYHSKRLIRRPREMEDFIDLIEATGAVVLTVASGDMDLSTAAGRMTARLFGALGSMETEENSERIRAQKAEAILNGTSLGGQRPFGYLKDRVTIHPKEGPAYRDLFRRVIEGESLSSIAALWEQQGFLNRRGERFDTTSIRAMIAQPRAVGRRVHKGEDFGEGDWEPITTLAVQRQAIAALKSRRSRPLRAAYTRRPPMLLSSLLTCGRCLKPLRAREGTLYKCDKNQSKGCGLKVNARSLEEEVQKRLLFRLRDPKTTKAITRLRSKRPDVSALATESQRLQHELAGYAADAAAGEMTRQEYKTIREGLQSKLDAVERKLEAMSSVPTISADPRAVVKGWDGFDLDSRRRHLGTFITTITVLPANGIKVFDPKRVDVDWRI